MVKGKRNEWYSQKDPEKRLFYKINLEFQCDKIVWDALTSKYGEQEVKSFLKRNLDKLYNMDAYYFYDLIKDGVIPGTDKKATSIEEVLAFFPDDDFICFSKPTDFDGDEGGF